MVILSFKQMLMLEDTSKPLIDRISSLFSGGYGLKKQGNKLVFSGTKTTVSELLELLTAHVAKILKLKFYSKDSEFEEPGTHERFKLNKLDKGLELVFL